jgi:hypothetical protein
LPDEPYVIAPGARFALRDELLHGLPRALRAHREHRRIGGEAARSGTNWSSWYIGARPVTLSASGMIEIDDSASSSV